MKLVFVLIVLINNVPQDPILFDNIQACNQIAFSTEKGIAGETASWSSQKNSLEAYCVPKVVEKNRSVISISKK